MSAPRRKQVWFRQCPTCRASSLGDSNKEMEMESVGSPVLWIGFTVFVLGMLAVDLGVFHRDAHQLRVREALAWTAVWISLAMLFNLGVYFWFGSQRALEFLTGYVIEKALSVDNIFVFLVVFSAFSVLPKFQHLALFWGVLGALLTRAIFIVLGAALLQQFHWVAYVFGAFLVLTGIKLLVQGGGEAETGKHLIYRLFRRLIPSMDDYGADWFTVVNAGTRYATPLLPVIVAIEATDIVFAVDSIPAIFAVTKDPFIVYTSNVFAMLGLRALYFAVAGMMEKFHYLKIGLSPVLAGVGAKMLLAGVYKVPIVVSLSVIGTLLAGSVVASMLWPIKKLEVPAHPRSPDQAPEALP
jgi:TerC family integral membrane protein